MIVRKKFMERIGTDTLHFFMRICYLDSPFGRAVTAGDWEGLADFFKNVQRSPALSSLRSATSPKGRGKRFSHDKKYVSQSRAALRTQKCAVRSETP